MNKDLRGRLIKLTSTQPIIDHLKWLDFDFSKYYNQYITWWVKKTSSHKGHRGSNIVIFNGGIEFLAKYNWKLVSCVRRKYKNPNQYPFEYKLEFQVGDLIEIEGKQIGEVEKIIFYVVPY